MKHFESFMAPQLQQYAAYRQVLGYAKKCIKPPLLAFDRYLIEQNASWDQVLPPAKNGPTIAAWRTQGKVAGFAFSL